MSTTSYMCKKSQVSEYEQIIKYMLWFDVEKRYKTTLISSVICTESCGLM